MIRKEKKKENCLKRNGQNFYSFDKKDTKSLVRIFLGGLSVRFTRI